MLAGMKTMTHLALVASLLGAPVYAQTRPLSYDDYYSIRSDSPERFETWLSSATAQQFQNC